MTTKDAEAHNSSPATGAVGSLVERVVRPCAWMMHNPTHANLAPSLHWEPPQHWHITWDAAPLYDQAAIDAAVAAERNYVRAMLEKHIGQTVMSHHVSMAECHAARNALQLVLDEWA